MGLIPVAPQVEFFLANTACISLTEQHYNCSQRGLQNDKQERKANNTRENPKQDRETKSMPAEASA
jgi:hypothetical protein